MSKADTIQKLREIAHAITETYTHNGNQLVHWWFGLFQIGVVPHIFRAFQENSEPTVAELANRCLRVPVPFLEWGVDRPWLIKMIHREIGRGLDRDGLRLHRHVGSGGGIRRCCENCS